MNVSNFRYVIDTLPRHRFVGLSKTGWATVIFFALLFGVPLLVHVLSR